MRFPLAYLTSPFSRSQSKYLSRARIFHIVWRVKQCYQASVDQVKSIVSLRCKAISGHDNLYFMIEPTALIVRSKERLGKSSCFVLLNFRSGKIPISNLRNCRNTWAGSYEIPEHNNNACWWDTHCNITIYMFNHPNFVKLWQQYFYKKGINTWHSIY